MSSEFVGTVQNVTEIPVGSTLDEDASSGASSLKPADIEEFNPDGGKLQIGDEVFTYTMDGDELDLSGTTSQSYDEGEPIYTYPPTYERWAWVREPGAEEALQVRVPHALWDRLPLGVRSEDDAEEVECELTIDGVAVISDVIAREPRVDGEFIQDHTVRPEVITDGEPPASSPTPEVSGGIGSLVVKWDAVSNHDPVTYEVHLSSSSGFTPGPTTLAAEVQGTIVFLRTLPNGDPLAGGTDYHVKIIARDKDGSAAPSAQGSGQIALINTGDVGSDGDPPAFSPTPGVTGSTDFLFVEWEPVENNDPVVYEVYHNTAASMPATPKLSTSATSAIISGLAVDTSHFVWIVATDPDGAASPSTPGFGTTVKIQGTKIADNAIATPHLQANSVIAGKIATNAVTADTIATNAVTASKILANAVTADKINTGAVTTQKLASESVTTAKLNTDDLIANSATIGLLQGEFAEFNRLSIPDTSGQRLEQSVEGIRLYNSNDELTADLSTQTGNAYMRGRVDFGQGSALLPGDTIELADQGAAGFETPELIRVEYRSGSGSNTGLAFGMPSGAPAGTVRIMVISSVANTTHTLADFSGELASYWELVGSVNSAGQGRLSMYVRTDDSTPTVLLPTVNFGASTDWRAQILEYVGLELEDEDVVNTASGTGTGISISTGTTTQTHELVLGALMVDAPVFTVDPSGYTRVAQPRPVVYAKSVTTTGAQSLSATQFFGTPWLAILATFKCRAATGAPVAPDAGGVRLYSADERPAFIDSNEDGGELALVSEIPTIASGTSSVFVSGNSAVSGNIAHGLGVTPTTIVVTPRDSNNAVADVRSRNSTNFTVGIKHRDNGSNLNTTVNFDWIAMP